MKTPLAILCQEVERADAAKLHDFAGVMSPQLDRMRRHIEYHLAQTRSDGGGSTIGVRCSVKEAAGALSRTLGRLYVDRGISLQVKVSEDVAVRVRQEDFEEMLGNLMDNACKWAKRRIVVESSQRNNHVVINIDDDGPGIDPSMRANVLQRGVRTDNSEQGSGLGLAIVLDLVELHGGSLTLQASPAGGLRAQVELPS